MQTVFSKQTMKGTEKYGTGNYTAEKLTQGAAGIHVTTRTHADAPAVTVSGAGTMCPSADFFSSIEACN